MHIFGIIDLLAVAFVAAADVGIGWLKWGIVGILLVKGLHSQLM